MKVLYTVATVLVFGVCASTAFAGPARADLVCVPWPGGRWCDDPANRPSFNSPSYCDFNDYCDHVDPPYFIPDP